MAAGLRRLTLPLFACPALAAFVLSAAAADSAPMPDDPGQRARVLRDQAQELRNAADSRRAQTEAQCHDKFLVSACMEEARREHNRAFEEARAREIQAVEIERDLAREREARESAERERRAAQKREQSARGQVEQETARRQAAAGDAEDARRRAAATAQAARVQGEQHKKDAEKAQARAKRVEEARTRAAAAERRRAELDRRKAEKAAKRSREAATPAQAKPVLPALPGH